MLFCIHSSAHSSDVKISYHFENSELQRCFLFSFSFLFFCCSPGHGINCRSDTHPAAVQPVDSWATSLFVGLHEDRADGTEDAKANFWFGNIVRKQWTLSGFLQHTSTNTIYIQNNKTSQQLKVLHMNRLLQRVTHFSSEFLHTNTTTTNTTTLRWLLVYFWDFRTKIRNAEAHSWP